MLIERARHLAAIARKAQEEARKMEIVFDDIALHDKGAAMAQAHADRLRVHQTELNWHAGILSQEILKELMADNVMATLTTPEHLKRKAVSTSDWARRAGDEQPLDEEKDDSTEA